VDIGVKISGTAHAILISIAIFGAPIFSSDEENPIQISEVSLISLEEFELLTKEPEARTRSTRARARSRRAGTRARSTRARTRTRSSRNY